MLSFEVQRTIRRVELTAFFCLLRMIIRHTTAHVDNKGIIDGLCREEMKGIAPQSEGRRPVDVDLGGGAQISSRRNTL